MATTLLWSGIAVVWLDFMVCEWLASVQPEFDPVTHFVSELGEDGRSSQSTFEFWCTAVTLMLLPFCGQLFREARQGPTLRVFAWGSTLYAVCNGFLNAMFPCDPGCVGATWSAKLHIFVSGLAITMAIGLPLHAARHLQNVPEFQTLSRRSRLLSVFMILITVAMAGIQYHVPPMVLLEPIKGLVQAGQSATFLIWLTGFVRAVLGTSKHPGGG